MKLEFDNCKVLFEDSYVDCSYDYILGEKVHWTLHLGKNLTFKGKNELRSFEASGIKEFIFEIDQRIQRAHNLTQIAKAYVIFIDSSEPNELFRLCVRQETNSSISSKSYEFTEEIVKKLSEHYKKPYSYKRSVATKRKNKELWISAVCMLIAVMLAILLALWTDK